MSSSLLKITYIGKSSDINRVWFGKKIDIDEQGYAASFNLSYRIKTVDENTNPKLNNLIEYDYIDFKSLPDITQDLVTLAERINNNDSRPIISDEYIGEQYVRSDPGGDINPYTVTKIIFPRELIAAGYVSVRAYSDSDLSWYDSYEAWINDYEPIVENRNCSFKWTPTNNKSLQPNVSELLVNWTNDVSNTVNDIQIDMHESNFSLPHNNQLTKLLSTASENQLVSTNFSNSIVNRNNSVVCSNHIIHEDGSLNFIGDWRL